MYARQNLFNFDDFTSRSDDLLYVFAGGSGFRDPGFYVRYRDLICANLCHLCKLHNAMQVTGNLREAQKRSRISIYWLVSAL